jgi:Lon protease-like protein
MDIIVEGRDRFRVTRVKEIRSYLTAEVQPFADARGDADPELVAACLAALERVADVTGTDAAAIEVGGGNVAWHIAAQVDFGTEFKQELLEMQTENERLQHVGEALNRAATAIAHQKEIRDRAAGNGKVDHL